MDFNRAEEILFISECCYCQEHYYERIVKKEECSKLLWEIAKSKGGMLISHGHCPDCQSVVMKFLQEDRGHELMHFSKGKKLSLQI